MEHKEDRFKTFDKLSLYQQWWRPDGEPKAVVIIIHGSFEHSARYINVASYFVENGYAVYAFDLRGHGKSGGERAFIPSFEVLLQDLNDFLLYVRQREPQRPIFLLGHSVGATLVVLFVITHTASSDIKGMILSAPALKMGNDVPFLIRTFSTLIGYFFPKLKLNKLNSSFLSQDPEVISSYNNDPLVYKGGLFAGSVREFIRAINKIQSQMEKVEIPLLILHGTEDHLSDVEGSRQLYLRACSTDKNLKLYEGFYHELFNEPDKEKVFTDIVSWLNSHS